MTVCMSGSNLDPAHPVAPVVALRHIALDDRLREARPARLTIVLVDRGKERLPGHNVHVDARLLVVPISITERAFGCALLGDTELLRGQSSDGLWRFAVLRLQVISSVFSITDTATMVAPGQSEISCPDRLDSPRTPRDRNRRLLGGRRPASSTGLLSPTIERARSGVEGL